ncbi:prepilin-type N-terminal cleavage/methylation domain-containing protein [Bacillus sp. T3]|nr:prepilin-type N-terminal cleavage/methylation domain-containing protein [Bacillus sp. T3]
MNNKGFTLIELLAGIAIATLVILITMSIFMTGMKQSVDTKKK